jgi:hypothetical protein
MQKTLTQSSVLAYIQKRLHADVKPSLILAELILFCNGNRGSMLPDDAIILIDGEHSK